MNFTDTDTNSLIHRANAEGFTVEDLKSAATRVQAREVLEAECLTGYQTFAEPQQFSVDEMAKRISKSANYRGGYMFPGTRFSHGLDALQPHYWSNAGNSTDSAPLEKIIEALSAIPIMEKIEELTNFNGNSRYDYYLKNAEGFSYIGYSDQNDDDFYQNKNYVTANLVAKELGLPCSNTLVTLFYEFVN